MTQIDPLLLKVYMLVNSANIVSLSFAHTFVNSFIFLALRLIHQSSNTAGFTFRYVLSSVKTTMKRKRGHNWTRRKRRVCDSCSRLYADGSIKSEYRNSFILTPNMRFIPSHSTSKWQCKHCGRLFKHAPYLDRVLLKERIFGVLECLVDAELIHFDTEQEVQKVMDEVEYQCNEEDNDDQLFILHNCIKSYVHLDLDRACRSLQA